MEETRHGERSSSAPRTPHFPRRAHPAIHREPESSPEHWPEWTDDFVWLLGPEPFRQPARGYP